MDQIAGQTAQPPDQAKQSVQPSPISISPPVRKQPSTGYFSRLFSGRINRRNFFLGFIIISIIPLVFLIISAIPAFITGFIQELTSPSSSNIRFGSQNNVVGNIVSIIMILATIVWFPFFIINFIALLVRRWHDVNQSGWLWLLYFIPFINIVVVIYLLFFKGTVGENKYGTQPLPRINVKQDILRLS